MVAMNHAGVRRPKDERYCSWSVIALGVVCCSFLSRCVLLNAGMCKAEHRSACGTAVFEVVMGEFLVVLVVNRPWTVRKLYASNSACGACVLNVDAAHVGNCFVDDRSRV